MISSEKMKSLSFKSTDLENHGQALYYLLSKHVVNSLVQWKKTGSDIKELADCLYAYSKNRNYEKLSLERSHSKNN